MHILRAWTGWLFISGLILPAAYIAFWPGVYFAIWYRIVASIIEGGATLIIFFAGLVSVITYLSKLFSSGKSIEHLQAISNVNLSIHMGVAVTVSLMTISAVLSGVPSTELAFRAFSAFLITEFILFPLIDLLHLQDIIRHRDGGLATILLLSTSLYVCIALLTTSNLFELDPATVNIQKMTVLETAGARLFLLLIFIVAFICKPLFWESTSFYSFDIAPPPIWVSGLYALTLALFLYYQAHRTSGAGSKLGSTNPYLSIPVDIVRTAITILIATALAFLVVSGADLLIPHNVAGKALQLLVLLVSLLIALIMTTGEAQQP